jgi:hypothetical protein
MARELPTLNRFRETSQVFPENGDINPASAKSGKFLVIE